MPWSEGSEIFNLVTLRDGVYALRWRSAASHARFTGLVNLEGKSGSCPALIREE